MEDGRRRTPSVSICPFWGASAVDTAFLSASQNVVLCFGPTTVYPRFLARAALTKVRAHGSRENRASLQRGTFLLPLLFVCCVLFVVFCLLHVSCYTVQYAI